MGQAFFHLSEYCHDVTRIPSSYIYRQISAFFAAMSPSVFCHINTTKTASCSETVRHLY